MTTISDNFVRSNGALGANWATPVPCNPDFAGWGGTPAGSVLISNNGVGADATNGADAFCLWAGGQTFGNDQWATATIKTIASPTATLSITAASQSGGNTTYTYTVTAGSVAAAISGGFLYVIISNMADNGNNGHFVATTFGAGTFTVANATGITRSGQSGIGFCASDCGAGVGVRLSGTSAATMNGYYFHVGTNSFNGDGRKAYYELWKIVNGVGSTLAFATGATALGKVVPTVGDVIGITAVGSQITAYYNGIILTGGDKPVNGIYQVTDTDIVGGGVPGLFTFAISGANEYHYSTWTSGSAAIPGNNGTTLNAFSAGDIGAGTQLVSENFTEVGTFGQCDLVPYANGDLHTVNANWAYQGSSTFTVTSGKVFSGLGANPGFAYRSDVSAPTNDQWAEEILSITGTTNNNGPAVRISSSAQTAYIVQCTSALLRLTKYVAGTPSTLGNAASPTTATGDSIRITAIGTAISVYKNGVLVIGPITDPDIASGNVGIFSSTGTQVNSFSKWAGGSITELTAATTFVTDTNQNALLDVTNGIFAGRADASNHVQIFENSLVWDNNQYAQATITGAVSSIFCGPTVRGGTGYQAYLLSTNNGSTTLVLYRLVTGQGGVALATFSHTSIVGDVLRLEASGPYLVAKLNGTTVIQVMDAAITSGKPGLIWATLPVGSGLKPLASFSSFSAGSTVQAASSGSWMQRLHNFANKK